MVLPRVTANCDECKMFRRRSERRSAGYARKAAGRRTSSATLSGLNRAHVGEIERGESNVTIQTLKIVADTLGVRIHDLIGRL